MLRNYLAIAFRNLRKQPGYTLINVVGLALGIACCLLIFLLVTHEWSYDAFHVNENRIHRVYMQEEGPDGSLSSHLLTPPSLAPAMDSAFSAVVQTSRVITGAMHFKQDERSFSEQVLLADSAFFDMFSFPLLAGNPKTVLTDLQSAVITEETARKYFDAGRTEYDRVLGQRLTLIQGEDAFDYQVSGVAASIPSTSSLDFDIALSFQNYYLEENGRLFLGGNSWGSKNTMYVLLRPDVDPKVFGASLGPFTRAQLADRIEARQGAAFLAEGNDALQLRLQPLRDMHLNPEIGNYYEAAAHNPTYSYVLGGIGLLVLLVACINFMTLSIGRSASRAREVGVRKVLGAYRMQLMKQFWGEALLLVFVSLLAALLVVYLAMPEFNLLTGNDLSPSSLSSWTIAGVLAAILLLVGLIAGAYPAAVLSGFRPAEILKGEAVGRKSRLTRGLVVAQYGISVGLIFCTLVMYRQLDFMLNKDVGFEDDQVLVVHTPGLNTNQERLALESMRSGLASNPNVTHVLRTGYAFTHSYDTRSWQGPDGTTVRAHMLGIDYDFLDVLEMDLVAGRDFSRDRPSDSTTAVLVNEAFVETYGFEEPVGRELSGFDGFFGDIDPTIIGVVRDFNFRSLHEEVEPAVLNIHPDYYHGMSHMLVKVRPENIQESIAMVGSIWRQTFPEKPFHFSFLDEDVAAQYQDERRWSTILSYSSILAIAIACMGLFGLATLSVSRRRKEIGIRKVLGATVSGVAALVAREFAVLVGIAAVIAWPLAYVGMREWLDGFAYRTSIPWWIFIAAGAAALLIALMTVSYQAYRAAVTDPVRSLRYE